MANSTYSKTRAARLCAEISTGVSVRQVCREDWAPCEKTFYVWLSKHEEFQEAYARAKETAAERMAEEILEISDDGTNDWMEREADGEAPAYMLNKEHVQRSRLRVESRKWLMSKLLPKKYGDKQRLEHTDGEGGPLAPVLNVTINKGDE